MKPPWHAWTADWIPDSRLKTGKKRGISAILARYAMKTRQMGAIPPSVILSRKGIARYGGVSHTGPLSWPSWLLPSSGPFSIGFFSVSQLQPSYRPDVTVGLGSAPPGTGPPGARNRKRVRKESRRSAPGRDAQSPERVLPGVSKESEKSPKVRFWTLFGLF